MSKAVLISIRPEWCQKIMEGLKTIEVRKTRPKMDTPFKCYIYYTEGRPDLNIPISQERLMRDYLETGSMKSLNCPLGNGKVIGEFICDRVYELAPLNHAPDDAEQQACLTQEEIARYLKGVGYGWHISNLRIYDHPRDLWELTGLRQTKYGLAPGPITRPPQSWRYVEEELWND